MTSAYPADLYDAVHVGTPGDVAFYGRVCAGAASILELGCGSGRVLAALDEPGRTLVGLDTSPDALAIAAAHVPRARLIRAAMQELDLEQRFDRVIAPFSALYCLESADQLARTLAAAVRHLRPGGAFVADVWNAEEFHADGDPEEDELSPLVQIDARGTTYHVYERSEWDRDQQRLVATYEYRSAHGETIVATIAHRYFLRAELERALEASGARSWKLESGFRGAPWNAAGELTVIRLQA